MPRPSMIAWNNLALTSGVTFTATSEATGHPASHLASAARWKDWRSGTTTSAVTMEIDLGSIQTVYAVAIVDAVIFAGGSVRLETKQTSGGSYVVQGTFSLPSFNPTGVSVLWHQHPARYVRLNFLNPNTVSAFVQLGVVYIAGGLFTARAPVAPGAGFSRVDQSIQRRAIGGARSAVIRPKLHAYQGLFHLASTTDRDAFASLFDGMGTSHAVILALDPATPQLVAYGTLAGFTAMHRAQSVDLWDIPVQFTEDVA
jgi:hypothetical protein